MELVREFLARTLRSASVQTQASPRVGSRPSGGTKRAIEVTLLREAGLKSNVYKMAAWIGEHRFGTLDSRVQEPLVRCRSRGDSECAAELRGRQARELRQIRQSNGLIHIVAHEIS